jgi:uncharacterized protein YecT (DUF1311 family)
MAPRITKYRKEQERRRQRFDRAIEILGQEIEAADSAANHTFADLLEQIAQTVTAEFVHDMLRDALAARAA